MPATGDTADRAPRYVLFGMDELKNRSPAGCRRFASLQVTSDRSAEGRCETRSTRTGLNSEERISVHA
jgi:hypothetical protein